MKEDRPADVVTMMWNNDDGTVTTETVDYTTDPMTRTTRIWAGWDTDTLDALAASSVVVPDEVLL